MSEPKLEHELMWCLSCGTVTDDGGCDCTDWMSDGPGPKQRLIPIWLARTKELENLAAFVDATGKLDEYVEWTKTNPIQYESDDEADALNAEP